MATHRIFNFSAGPAVLPEAVIKAAQRDLLALPDVGMSVLEISHRSTHFDAILRDAERTGGLPRTVFAGRCQFAIWDGADEPARGK